MFRIQTLFLVSILFLVNCASVNVKKASPAEYGYGFQMSPGWQIGESNTSVHGLMSYTRLGFDGGHDNMSQFGGQIRRSLSENPNVGFWIGGEAAYVKFTSVYDDEDIFLKNPSSAGFAMGALAGYKFPMQSLPISGYAGLGFVNFGDFTTDEFVIDEGGTGFTLRLGICVHVLSLLHKKGR